MSDGPNLTIRREWPRPDAALIARYKDIPTGWVTDALGRNGAMDYQIKPVYPFAGRICGPALPAWVRARDNMAVYAANTVAKAGDILVLSTHDWTGSASLGDLAIGMVRNAGCVAVVTDGLVRDIEGIEDVGIPVFARGISPNSPFRQGPGTVGLPVSVGGVVVNAGDMIIGDRNGVVVVPFARIAEVADTFAATREIEKKMEAAVIKGTQTLPGGFEKTMASLDIKWV
ncbi:4-hydroxy-4-methyl-2-oxoglutarate aldolase [Variibacter gotjawalensis]|uniref:Putative 4-hydroxy-4-methyl-2-oxoglutarate aldolase n=1 Tax=Variibacter gotjawalensis TaxID=1333996 RepID=A0A0S3PZG4_9BRAD|nr:aldolase [Variibacter gotjawalensis]NIK47157.1 4-hydroxy-4-methyl-2-oxoglutarate aldolase [Variibacter gotjawalensis]RZS49057.1 regulator of RNase E activity RraA [Variibacter gotjawalensis]BAT61319.1 4-hydroxy-4-methyl-2-oxoglutarate aldolase [Variibacter gotjawalensis]